MQLTDEFEVVLRKVAQELNAHTGESKFHQESSSIITSSQGQELSAKFTQITHARDAKFSYMITFNECENKKELATLGPFEHNDAERCSSHIYGLIISKLGDKVMESLLN